MPVIHDDELGKITIRRSVRSKHITMRIAPDGSLRVSVPTYSPLFLIKRSIASSKSKLKKLLREQRPLLQYRNGDQIGKSHSITVREGATTRVDRDKLRIIVTLASDEWVEVAQAARTAPERTLAVMQKAQSLTVVKGGR